MDIEESCADFATLTLASGDSEKVAVPDEVLTHLREHAASSSSSSSFSSLSVQIPSGGTGTLSDSVLKEAVSTAPPSLLSPQKSSGIAPRLSEFQKFMEEHRVREKGKIVTHTTMPLANSFPGKFSISEEASEEFLSKYIKEISLGKDVAMIEKHLSCGPIVVDLDFRHRDDVSPARIYDVDFVKELISHYWNSIEKYIDISMVEHASHCYVTEKSAATFDEVNGVWKDGLHLMFPHIITEPTIQYVIRIDVLKAMESRFLGMHLDQDPKSVIDHQVIYKNGWMMYGSHKQGKEAYAMHGEDGDDSFASGVYVAHRMKKNVMCSSEEEFSKPCGSSLQMNKLVRILSIRRCNVSDLAPLTETGKQEEEVYTEQNLNTCRQEFVDANMLRSGEDYSYARGLVDLLDIKRADTYDSWFELGCCLRNIDIRLLDKWIEFSQRSPLYQPVQAEISCKEKWNAMNSEEPRERKIGFASLIYWAQKDNRILFNEYQRDSLEYKITDCCKAYATMYTETDEKTQTKKLKVEKGNVEKCIHHITTVLLHLFKHEFVCSSFQSREWYQFINHRWQRTDKGVDLRRKIREDLFNTFCLYQARFEFRMKNTNPLTDSIRHARLKNFAECCKRLTEIVHILKYRDLIMNTASELFYWTELHENKVKLLLNSKILVKAPSQFQEVLDCHIYLVGMNNGVYDLQNHVFRAGRPEDYIMMSTCNDYSAYSMESEEIREINAFLSQILPCEDLRVYVLLTISSFLDGHTGSEKFYIWSGCGGNGKSKLVELIKHAIGDYYANLPVTAMTGTRAASNAATPELARLKGKRFAVMNEPDEGNKLQVGMLKELTGGDTIIARHLHQEPIEFKPTHETVLLTNHNPKVPANDEGTWRRIRLVQFTSRFLENPDILKRDSGGFQIEFKKDTQLDKKLVLWREPFFWLMTYYYRIYRCGDPEFVWQTPDPKTKLPRKGIASGIVEPQQVIEFTQRYRSLNDPFSKFLEVAVTEDARGSLYLSDLFLLFNHYKTRQKTQYSGNKTDFQEYMEQSKFGKMNLDGVHEGWCGFKLNQLAKIPDCTDFKDKHLLLGFREEA